MAKKAAEAVYKKAGLTPQDVDVVELHDCFSANELISYEALGLCAPGEYKSKSCFFCPENVKFWLAEYVNNAVLFDGCCEQGKPEKWWIEGTTRMGANMW